LVEEVWNDEQIGGGQEWKKEIKRAMNEASIAVMLISANFLTSNFILDVEVKDLLARREKDGMIVYPILAKECLWETVEWLAQLQIRPQGARPVWRRGGRYAEDELGKITRELAGIIKKLEQQPAKTPTQPESKSETAATTTADLQASQRGVAIGGDQSGIVVTGDVQNLYINTPAVEQEKQAKAQAEQERLVREKTARSPSPIKRGDRGGEVLTLAPNVTLELVRVPAGEFLMGSDKSKDKDAYDEELPQHKVTLDTYLIGKYPVTVAQFAVFVKATGRKFELQQDVVKKANHPITHVTWKDARAFCEWASKVTNSIVRLPTEAEWEKAARGTGGRIYPWGDEVSDETRCNFEGNIGDTTSVGQYSPRGDSPYGCADMAGNVWEWTSSIFKPYPYRSDDGRENLEVTGALRALRVLRGGSWDSLPRSCRSALRDWDDAADFANSVGLRVVRSPVGS
jgi:formylglycine-generating enzyme required for sulfatase activity